MSSCGWLEALLEAAAAQSITQLAAPRVGMKCDVHATAAAPPGWTPLAAAQPTRL